MEGGWHFAALKGTTFMDPEVIADTAWYLDSELAAKRHRDHTRFERGPPDPDRRQSQPGARRFTSGRVLTRWTNASVGFLDG